MKVIVFFALLLVPMVYSNEERILLRGENSKNLPHILSDGLWERHLTPVAQDDIMHLTIALRQSVSIATLDELVLAVSSPSSPKYGNYFTIEQIRKLVAPPEAEIHKVVSWLKPHAKELSLAKTGDYVLVEIPASSVVELFAVNLAVFHHIPTQTRVIRATNAPTLPSSIAPFIDLVVGLTDFYVPQRISSTHKNQAHDFVERNSNTQQLTTQKDIVKGVIPTDPFVYDVHTDEKTFTVRLMPFCAGREFTVNTKAPCSEHPPVFTGVTFSILDQFNVSLNLNVSYSDMPCIPQTWGSLLCNVTVGGVLDHTALWVSMVETFADGNVSYAWKPETAIVVEPQIWPKDIRALYNIPLVSKTNASNIVSIASFSGESYTQADLDNFCDHAGIPRKTLEKVWSNFNRSSPEGTLDVQTIAGLVGDARLWFIGQPNNTKFMLEWAIQVLDMGADGPLVHSISYGLDEKDVNKDFGVQYLERGNVELAKIALLGKTVVIASGDQGAPGRDESCNPLHATWPGSSPYATSVGATRISRAEYPECWKGNAPYPSKCYDIGEIATANNYGCFWTTGGGFSNTSLAPTWQRQAIKSYLSSGAPIPPDSVFNISGRAYPDVAALGHNIALWVAKGVTPEDGTSASTPIFASIVTLLNNIRLNNGLPPMGFINPWLYEVGAKYPEAFNDIITGDNTCASYDLCCTIGYFCEPGWDPVTGLGTPNYAVLADLVLKVK